MGESTPNHGENYSRSYSIQRFKWLQNVSFITMKNVPSKKGLEQGGMFLQLEHLLW